MCCVVHVEVRGQLLVGTWALHPLSHLLCLITCVFNDCPADAAFPFVGGGTSAKTLEMLQQRVKRQENLLQRCKETIGSHKEQCALLLSEKEALQEQLEERLQELEKMKVRHSRPLLCKCVQPAEQVRVWPVPPLGSHLHPPVHRQGGEGVLV